MGIKRDLLKDKLFDAKLYNTVFLNKEDEQRVRKEQMGILVDLLTDEKHKSSQTEVFNLLKKERKAVDLLITAISEAKDKKKLVAACWEADIDCDRYLPFFTNLVLEEELPVALEAFTTIENMRGTTSPPEIELCMKEAMEIYPEFEASPKGQLIADFIELLRKWQA